jgi:hypothetical protein
VGAHHLLVKVLLEELGTTMEHQLAVAAVVVQVPLVVITVGRMVELVGLGVLQASLAHP